MKPFLLFVVAPVCLTFAARARLKVDEPATSDALPLAGRMTIKTESFDRDPGWLGVNNRSARMREPETVRQDFGFSPGTGHVGGASPGEIGGFISPAGQIAFYGKPIVRRALTGRSQRRARCASAVEEPICCWDSSIPNP